MSLRNYCRNILRSVARILEKKPERFLTQRAFRQDQVTQRKQRSLLSRMSRNLLMRKWPRVVWQLA